MKPYLVPALKDLGMMIQIPGWMALPALLVAWVNQEEAAIVPFLLLILAGIGGGTTVYLLSPQKKGAPYPVPMIVVALSWLVISLLGAIPYYGTALLSGKETEAFIAYGHPVRSWFESMSGFSSTGLTMSRHPAELPYALQWWRSFSEWIGGVGIAVLAVAFLQPSEKSFSLFSTEAREKTIVKSVRESAIMIWWIYFSYTLFGILGYMLLNMPPWQAVNHGMTAIATGGFSVIGESYKHFSSPIKLFTVVLVVLGSIDFKLHYRAVAKRRWRSLQRDSQMRAYGILWPAGFLFLFCVDWLSGQDAGFVNLVFQWAQAFGTCGLSSVELKQWAVPMLMVLMSGMLIGGFAGSTAGGIKISRVIWLAKGAWWKFRYLKQPGTKPSYDYDGKKVRREKAMRYITFGGILAFLWVFFIFAATTVISALEGIRYSLQGVLFASVSAIGNVGLDTGVVGPELHPVSQLILALLMWLGRLEIMAVIMLLAVPVFKISDKFHPSHRGKKKSYAAPESP